MSSALLLPVPRGPPFATWSVHDPQGNWAGYVAVFPVGLLFFDADAKLVGAA